MPLRILLQYAYSGNTVIVVSEEMLTSFLIRVMQKQFRFMIK